MYNKVILIGRLTRDPELRHTPSGVAVCNISMALNRKYKKNDEMVEDVTFVDITVWDTQGENCNKYLLKGSVISVDGRLQLDIWEDDRGNKRSKLKIIANSVVFLSQKRSDVEDISGTERTERQDFVNDDKVPF